MRLKDKVAVVIGAGQGPGEGMGNGRATVIRFVQEGAKVLAVDRDLASAEETVAMAAQHGGDCVAFRGRRHPGDRRWQPTMRAAKRARGAASTSCTTMSA